MNTNEEDYHELERKQQEQIIEDCVPITKREAERIWRSQQGK